LTRIVEKFVELMRREHKAYLDIVTISEMMKGHRARPKAKSINSILVAYLTALLLISSPLNALPLANAHFSLGRLTGNGPNYVVNDLQPNHVDGPMGYVWPGGGLWWEEVQSSSDPPISGLPGYSSPWLQMKRNSYSPHGAILTSSIYPDGSIAEEIKGDLIFGLNWSGPISSPMNYTRWTIYVPPEFEPPVGWEYGDTSNIVTSITNDYYLISVHRADEKDPFGPKWWVIHILTEEGFPIHFGPEKDYWYYVRVNGMRSPIIAGKYFFKMFLNNAFPASRGPNQFTVPVENYPQLLVKGELDPAVISGTVRFAIYELYGKPMNLPGKVWAEGDAIDPYKWPELVKTGRKAFAVCYFNASAWGHYCLEGIPPGIYRIRVSAAGFPKKEFSGIVVGPGQSLTMDFYLEAGPVIQGTIYSKCGLGEIPWPEAGASEGGTGIGRPVSIEIRSLEGELLSFSPINLTHPPYIPFIFGNAVWDPNFEYRIAKFLPKPTAFPWEYRDPLGDGVAYPPQYAQTDPSGCYNGVGPAQAWWTGPGSTRFDFQFGRIGWYGAPSEFDGHVPQAFATWTSGVDGEGLRILAFVNGYVQAEDCILGSVGRAHRAIRFEMDLRRGSWINLKLNFLRSNSSKSASPIGGPEPGRYVIVEALNRNDELSGFNFTYLGAGNSSCTIQVNGLGMAGPDNNWSGWSFVRGMKYSLYGYSKIRDRGLLPGTYRVKVHVRGYLQAEELEATVSLCSSPVNVSLRLLPGGSLNLTINSKSNQIPTLNREWRYGPESPMNPGPMGAGVVVRFYGMGRGAGSKGYLRFLWNSSAEIYEDLRQVSGESSLPFQGWPSSLQKLLYNGSNLAEVFGPDYGLLGGFASPPSSNALLFWGLRPFSRDGFLWDREYYPSALERGIYRIRVWTFGYIQKGIPSVYVDIGAISDISIDLFEGSIVNATILFKSEGIIQGTPFDLMGRMRLYDEVGRLAAADTWYYIKRGAKGITWAIGGFSGGWQYESPIATVQKGAIRWDGEGFKYKDPSALPEPRITSIESELGYGIPPGTYKLRLDFVPLDFDGPGSWVPCKLSGEEPDRFKFNHLGPYSFGNEVVLKVGPGGEASIIAEGDARGLLYGRVFGYNWKGILRTLSWAQVMVQNRDRQMDLVYSYDGFFETFIERGNWSVEASVTPNGPRGYSPSTAKVSIEEGSFLCLIFELERSSLPLNEFGPMRLEIHIPVIVFFLSLVHKRNSVRRPKKP
jgi:hypothetical protein